MFVQINNLWFIQSLFEGIRQQQDSRLESKNSSRPYTQLFGYNENKILNKSTFQICIVVILKGEVDSFFYFTENFFI